MGACSWLAHCVPSAGLLTEQGSALPQADTIHGAMEDVFALWRDTCSVSCTLTAFCSDYIAALCTVLSTVII